MQEIIVTANEAGQRFDKLLAKYLNEAPKSFLYKMLRKKNIVLNGKKATGSEKLQIGDSIKLFLSDETIEKFSKCHVLRAVGNIDIIYEDEHILLINKPVGVLSQKAKPDDVSMVEMVTSYLLNSGQLKEEDLRKFKPSVCNRLDRNTSGMIVAGKTLFGLQNMGELFKKRTIQKYYLCLVEGIVKERQYIKGYLEKDEKSNKVMIFAKDGEGRLPIETEYIPIRYGKDCTLLEVHLITGRTHQIRAHLSANHHPIIGDYKYGNHQVNSYYRSKYGLESQFLHAYRLVMPKESAFENLGGKEWRASLPKLFTEILEQETMKGSKYGNLEL